MDFTFNTLGKFVDNLTTTDEKMKDLKRKLEELNAVKQDLESRSNRELQHPRKKLKTEVELWFRNVERINGEILELEQKIEDSNVVSRGWGSIKTQVLKTADVEELYQRGKFHDSLVVDDSGWIGQALSTTTVFGGAAETCMQEIWAYMMDDDIQKIGVWGMGGVGKTTIMKLIHNQLLKETKKFNIVIWITVSKEMNIFKMQKRIARAMENTLVEDEVKTIRTLDEDEDETIRAGKIFEILARKGRYVLILDDLWEKLSLEEVGIPKPSNGSKLLVTTRLLDVCRHLECQEVKVPTLSKSDAWELFLKNVGQDVLNHPDLLPIAESVAEECAGLPLAIVTIASSMKGVHNIHEWRNAVHELNRHVESVNGMKEKVFHQLQFSYDRLQDEKMKHCFLCCALYPEDYEIHPDELIKLWIDEGLVGEMDSMQTEIDKGHTILNKLKNSCLIETVVETFDGDKVKLHDIVRDMALRITSVRPRFLVRAGMQLKEIPDTDWNEELIKASFMDNRGLQISSQLPPPKCQKLTTLLLSNCEIQSIPEWFFEQMHGLRILDLSYNRIESLPNSISNLQTLTSLSLHGCNCLEELPSFSKLEALKKLDLRETKIDYIPHGIERLVNLKYLDLRDTSLTEMDLGILAKLTSLQYLEIVNLQQSGDISVRGDEIGRLRKLEFFAGMFGKLNELNSYARTLHALPSQYYIYVGSRLFSGSSFGSTTEKLIQLGSLTINTGGIKILSNVEHLEFGFYRTADLCEDAFFSRFIFPVPLDIFSSLSEIDIYNCRNIKKLFSSNWVLHNLQNLESLCVSECHEMEEIIASESTSVASFAFALPKLNFLRLSDLPELNSICGANGVMVCDSIEQIMITDCPKLKRIPLNLSLRDDGQPFPPPSLKKIQISRKHRSQLEWDDPNAKSLFEPYLREW